MRFLVAILVVMACGCQPQSSNVSTGTSARPPIVETVSFTGNWQPHFVDIDNHKWSPFQSEENREAAKAVVFVFVLQDCPIANSYMPELNRLYESFAPRGIQMVMVEADPQITPDAARQHAEQYQIKMPVVIDRDHDLVHATSATKTPEAVVISHRGEVLYRGRIDDQYVALGKRRMQVTSHDLQEALEAVLVDKPVPQPRTEAIGCFIPELPHEGR